MEINGKPVVDATKPVTIKITPTDTLKGDNKNPSSCAAARAAVRSIEDCISARIHIGRVYIEHQNKWVRYDTPQSLRTEIIAFDKGGSFQPGEYKLNAIPTSETTEYRKDFHRGETNRNRINKTSTRSHRKGLKMAVVKRHNVTGIRPKGANR